LNTSGKFVNDRVRGGLAPRTVQQTHAVLRSALNRAMKRQRVSRNVATLVDLPRAPQSDIKPT